MQFIKIAVFLCILAWSIPSHSISDFRDAWRTAYPNSNSDEITGGDGCQLCHKNSSGNEPWNQYGWAIRSVYRTNGFDIDEAIELAESNNHDGDSLGVSSLDEINNDFQPGWTIGAVNSVFMANGTELSNQSPPSTPPSTDLDFPNDVLDNPISDVLSGAITIELNEIAAGFNAPLQATRAPGINGSLFVVEQAGKIYRVDLATGDKSLFHDVGADLVSLGGGNDERGLLGLAFHPNFASNGLFYTYQSEPKRAEQDSEVDFSTSSPQHRSMVVEYRVSDPSCNDHISKLSNLLIIDQPQGNHNGGDLAFGQDGYLYISLGDGGGSNDQGTGHGTRGNGRDNTNPLGSILRIDTDSNNSANGKYGIPNDNPFIGGGDAGVDEIFAYGLRNPFRFSFDSSNGDLYVGDVGQGDIEEVNIVENGDNLGWNWKEGSFFFYNSISTDVYLSNTAPPGLPNNLVDPIAEYDHGDGVSVIGGYVYRGSQIAALQGRYVFGEFLSKLFYLDAGNNILEFSGSSVSEFVTGFGQDSDNELYVITRVSSGTTDMNGKLQKIMPLGAVYSPPAAIDESAICPPSEELCIPIKSSNGSVAVICL